MPVCTGGSEPKPDAPAWIVLLGEGAAFALGIRYKFLGIVAGVAAPYVFDTATLCALDPPEPPTWTHTDILALLSPIQSDAKTVATAKLMDTLGNVLWYTFCQCTVGGPVTPPAPTAPPADMPIVNPVPIDTVAGGSGYVAEVIADSPVAYWRFAEMGGKVFNSIGPAPRYPFIARMPVAEIAGYSGPVSDGGSILTYNDSMEAKFTVQLATPPWTLEVWAWMPQDFYLSSSNWLSVGPAATRALDLHIANARHSATAQVSAGVNFAEFLATPQWQHLAFVHSGTQIETFTNGVSSGTLAHTFSAGVFGPIVIRTMSNPLLLSELAIYDTALSAARLLAHYNAADAKSSRPVYRGQRAAELGVVGGAAAAATPLLELVTLIQRQEVPFGYIDGPAHPGLSGSGSFAVSGLLGVRVDFTTIPAWTGYRAGNPDTYYDIGTVALGDTSGYVVREILRHDPQLIFSDEAGLFTVVGYTFPPGVVATITELDREP